MTKQDIAKINELAAKSRTTEGLTKEEAVLQKTLRDIYISEMRDSLKSQLDNTVIVDENGNRTKLKQK